MLSKHSDLNVNVLRTTPTPRRPIDLALLWVGTNANQFGASAVPRLVEAKADLNVRCLLDEEQLEECSGVSYYDPGKDKPTVGVLLGDVVSVFD